MFSISEAKLTLSLKQFDMFISVFTQNIIFGQLQNNIYKANQHFQIPFFQLQFWYLAIIDIIKAHTGKSDKTKNLIISFEPNVHYSWFLLDNQNICFVIEVQDNVTFKAHFTIVQFNNWILTLNSLIFHTLCLKPIEHFAFEEAASLSLEQILTLREKTKRKVFLKEIFMENYDPVMLLQCEITLAYYLEIIILKHKLTSLYNPQENISDKVINMIIQ